MEMTTVVQTGILIGNLFVFCFSSYIDAKHKYVYSLPIYIQIVANCIFLVLFGEKQHWIYYSIWIALFWILGKFRCYGAGDGDLFILAILTMWIMGSDSLLLIVLFFIITEISFVIYICMHYKKDFFKGSFPLAPAINVGLISTIFLSNSFF